MSEEEQVSEAGSLTPESRDVAIVGAGPAGLMAAERLSAQGHRVTVYDRMPSPARKFLLAGRGGLNLTHGEALNAFLGRYGETAAQLSPLIAAFPPEAVRAWCESLGQETFVGSSGRIFPRAMKASPLLRAWLQRLDAQGVIFRAGWRWQGFDAGGSSRFATPEGEAIVRPHATLLAMGGASWPKLGSDGGWVTPLTDSGIAVQPLTPANVGFTVAWSDFFRERFAGEPLKRIEISIDGRFVFGEALVTAEGIEGGALYALGPFIREALAKDRTANLKLDLRPDVTALALSARLLSPRGKESFSNILRKRCGLSPVAAALLREAHPAPSTLSAPELAELIKGLPLSITGVRPIDRAISSAGGIRWSELDEGLMLRAMPGIFAAGEMIDWEAPTGGYLLQACFSTGSAAAAGIDRYLSAPRRG
ncbi:MAG: NAD(P)/FAD-dependent oxidoreductase [Beijerinckiaceae bacterium]